MRIKQRIFFYNTLSVIAALIIMLVVNWGTVHWISDFYRQQESPAADDRLAMVQGLLNNWTELDRDWLQLDRQLHEMNYRLVVEQEHQPVYSSLNQFQDALYQRTSDAASWPEDGTLTIQNEGTLMVGRRSGEYTIVAMPLPQMPEMFGRQRMRSEATMISLLVSGVTAIGIIVLLSLLFSRQQIKQIMRPINALTDAAKRVEEGDLSTPVDYKGQDEFSSVCAAFDHMQKHLLQEREKNAAYEQARTDLVAGISHDLRTPLTSVKGYIKGLRDGVANTPEKQSQYLDIAYRKSCDMDLLRQRLFYFSKLETGNLPLFLVPADLGNFVQRFADEARAELEHFGSQVVLQQVPVRRPVQLDEEQMYRVLTNLKENALGYAGVQPMVLTLTLWRQGEWECLRFADNGRGVPEEQLNHLFEQFWRGDQSRSSRGGEGSGLGLSIAQSLTNLQSGKMTVGVDGDLFKVTLAFPLKD